MSVSRRNRTLSHLDGKRATCGSGAMNALAPSLRRFADVSSEWLAVAGKWRAFRRLTLSVVRFNSLVGKDDQ